MLKKYEFDIVVSDFKMPNGNGMKILSYINTMVEKRPIFFFVSGQADVSAEECIKSGASDFINKPFDIDLLIKKVSGF